MFSTQWYSYPRDFYKSDERIMALIEKFTNSDQPIYEFARALKMLHLCNEEVSGILDDTLAATGRDESEGGFPFYLGHRTYYSRRLHPIK